MHRETVVPRWGTATETAILDLVLVGDDGDAQAVDVVITHPLSAQNVRAAAVKDGEAARRAEVRKHTRYPGTGLIPAALEIQGRPGEELQAFVRTRAAHMDTAGRAVFIQDTWQLLAVTLQRANAAALDAAGAKIL